MPDLSGKTALVTGASSGIGAAMARQLAAWKCGLVLTARRADRLEALAAEVKSAHGVAARVLPADLSDRGAPLRLYEALRQHGTPMDIVINNAGFGTWEPFAQMTWERNAELLQLNVVSLVELCHRFLPDLLARPHRAHILNVASTAAFQPIPLFANYGASKAYVLTFSEALAAELKETNVRVTCVCPGGTTSEFSQVAGQTLNAAARSAMMSAERCAAISLRAMLRGKRVIVPGALNKVGAFSTRLVPRRTAGAIGQRLVGPAATPSLPAPGTTAKGG
ncbi:MAG TPA: SDR family oxidoreductase [Kofleriaceae bacterium]|nr:SDR family oxidoreductase [Kofleriaceae bacterium]